MSSGLPASFLAILRQAEALEPDPARRAALHAHYFTTLTSWHRDQVAADAPGTPILRAPIDWAQVPRLTAAVEALTAQSGVAWPKRLLARSRTVADLYEKTYFGGAFALLHGTPAALREVRRAFDEGQPVEALVDRFLAAPLVHELSHGPRTRDVLDPPFLDESVAAWVGVRALREFAFPARGETNGIFATPVLSQVGQGLARTFGARRVMATQLGEGTWADVLPHGFADRARALAWADWQRDRPPHFLPTRRRPHAWWKLFHLAAAGADDGRATLDSLEALPWADVPVGPEDLQDREILRDALSTTCLHARAVGGVWRVSQRPPPVPVVIDLDACLVTGARFADDGGGELPTYPFPPAAAKRLRRGGVHRLEVQLDDPWDLEPHVTALLGPAQAPA